MKLANRTVYLFDRITVHVVEFFAELASRINVEIIVAALPEPTLETGIIGERKRSCNFGVRFIVRSLRETCRLKICTTLAGVAAADSFISKST